MSIIFYKNQQDFFDLSKSLEQFFNSLKIYLIGGTGFSLQVEHRKSIDFDFATSENIIPDLILNKIGSEFKNITVTQIEENTLSFDWKNVKVSFFGGIALKQLKPHINYHHIKLISSDDFAAMKLRTILSRSTLKDYFDIAHLIRFENYSIDKLIELFYDKYQEQGKQFSKEIIIKSLTFFDDIETVNIELIANKDFWGDNSAEILGNVKKVIKSAVADHLNSL